MAQIRRRAARAVDMTPPSVARLLRTDRGATKLLRPLVNRMLPDQETEVTVRSGVGQGLRLCILPRTEKFYWTGLHEPHVQEALKRELRPGSVFWDIGAHIGFDSLIASRLVGPDGRVEAFEPFPANRRRLQTAIDMNGCPNVWVHAEAVSDRPGKASFSVHPSSLMGSLTEEAIGPTIEVVCTTLDELAGRLPRPDLVKVDVEGAELGVLRGGPRLLAEARPRLIVECTTEAVLAEACQLLPLNEVEHLGRNHWLFRPSERMGHVRGS